MENVSLDLPMEDNNPHTMAEETPTPKKKRVKKPRVTKSPVELHEMEPHRMNPEEMKSYIKWLRNEYATECAHVDQLEKQVNSTYEMNRDISTELEALRRAYTIKMNFVTGAVKTLSDSINLAVKGDIK